jgi:hypothetical protein
MVDRLARVLIHWLISLLHFMEFQGFSLHQLQNTFASPPLRSTHLNMIAKQAYPDLGETVSSIDVNDDNGVDIRGYLQMTEKIPLELMLYIECILSYYSRVLCRHRSDVKKE